MDRAFVQRFLSKQDIATLKAKEIIGEEKLKELLEAGIVPIEWDIYIQNLRRKNEILKKIKELVSSPNLKDLEADQ